MTDWPGPSGPSTARAAEELERDIEHTRATLSETLDAIERRLAPGQLTSQGLEYLRTYETRTWLGTLVLENPLPVALIGVGLAWLALAAYRRRPEHATGEVDPRARAARPQPDTRSSEYASAPVSHEAPGV